MPFAKGESGNSKGRPPGKRPGFDFSAAVRLKGEPLFNKLWTMASGKNKELAYRAICKLLEFGYAKPETEVVVTENNKPLGPVRLVVDFTNDPISE